ncbi:hypothetical protein C0992_010673, partial [Termitomyces sp. T32_za158]
EIFGTSKPLASMNQSQPVARPSNFDILRQQRAAKRAQLVEQQPEVEGQQESEREQESEQAID